MQKFNLAPLSRRQRLTLATVAALSLHILLFVSGWLVIQKISVPSNENRVMVLTLNSTPMDGLLEPAAEVEETLNDAKVGELASMPVLAEPTELSSLTTVPHPKATFELDPKPAPLPTPEIEAIVTDQPEKPTPSQVATELTPSDASPNDQNVEPSRTSAITVPSFARTDHTSEAVLTALDSEFSVSLASEQPPAERSDERQIEPKQRRMLERKIQRWAQQLATQDQVDQNFSWQHKGQTYSAKFTHLPASGDMDLDEMIVEVATIEDGDALTTTMRMKKLAFSNFAQFVHRWDPTVMIHDDEMNGRFHSNSQILLASDRKTRPIFHGKVTTASYRVDFENSVRRSAKREIFKGGLETGVKKIRMPKPQMLFAESVAGDNDSVTFETDTRIVFTPEGGFMWHPADEIGVPRYQQLPNHPMYITAEPGVTLFISGEVSGQVMVYSPERVVIEDDLTYAQPDFINTEEVLGIISGKDVVIAGQEMTGTGDLNIHASIYARRRFHVRDYSKAHTGTLRITGSVSAGSVSATQPRYATSITFDERFETLRPPGFPVTDRYEVTDASWNWE